MKFNVGDIVTIRGGKAHRWKVVGIEHQIRESEPGYRLDNGTRQRTATESVLTLVPPETPADRDAWLENARD